MTDDRWDKLDALLGSITGFEHVQVHGCTRETSDTVPYATIRDLVAAARERDELRAAVRDAITAYATGGIGAVEAVEDIEASLHPETTETGS